MVPPDRCSAPSHLLDLLDLCVVVTRRDLWVWLDLLIVFEQSGNLSFSKNHNLAFIFFPAIMKKITVDFIYEALFISEHISKCMIHKLDISFLIYHWVRVRPESTKQLKILVKKSAWKCHTFIFLLVSCESVDTAHNEKHAPFKRGPKHSTVHYWDTIHPPKERRCIIMSRCGLPPSMAAHSCILKTSNWNEATH